MKNPVVAFENSTVCTELVAIDENVICNLYKFSKQVLSKLGIELSEGWTHEDALFNYVY